MAPVFCFLSGGSPLVSAGESEAIASNASELVFLTWTVLASSEKKGLAADFVDFVNQPSRAARNAMFVQYATPNAAAEPLLPDEFLSDPAIYPGGETLRRSEFYVDLPANIVKLRNDVYARVVTSAPGEGAINSTQGNPQ